jgi:hypothetical protein
MSNSEEENNDKNMKYSIDFLLVFETREALVRVQTEIYTSSRE